MSALEDALRDPPRVVIVSAPALAGLARRRVSPPDIAALSLAAIGPSSGALIGTVAAAQIAGRGVWLAVLLATALAWTLAQVFGQYGSRIAGSGSLYTFVAHAAGARVSLVVLCALVVGYGCLAGFGTAQAAEHLVLAVTPEVHATPAVAAVVVLVALVVMFVMTRRAQVSTRVILVAEAAGILLLLVLLFAAFVTGRFPSAEDFSLADATPGQIALATTVMTGALLGFESSSALGAEASRPFASVPRAMSSSVLFSGCLYVLAVVGGAGVNPAAVGATAPSPIWFAESLAGGWATPVVHAVLALCFLPVALASWTALSRLVFLAGRERTAPRWLGAVEERSQIPRRAILVSAPLVLAAPVIVVASGAPSVVWSEGFSAVGSAALFAAYAIACFALPIFLRRVGEDRPVSTVVALGAGCAITGILVADVILHALAGMWFGLVVLPLLVAAAALWHARLRRFRGASLRLGVHDHAIASDFWTGSAV